MKVKVICEYCGKSILRWEYELTRTKNCFCSPEHAYAWRIGRHTQPCSEETKTKISKSNTGKIQTQETRNKISKKTKGKNNPFYGCKHTEKSRRLISEKNTGKKATIQTRQKMRETKLRFNNSFRGRLRSLIIKLI